MEGKKTDGMGENTLPEYGRKTAVYKVTNMEDKILTKKEKY